MKKFCFFCITYGGDYRAFVAMIESFKRHNVDKIPFVIAMQDESIKIPYGGGRVVYHWWILRDSKMIA